jgi:hypothetical protein
MHQPRSGGISLAQALHSGHFVAPMGQAQFMHFDANGLLKPLP